MADNTIKLSDFPLQSQLADTDTIILDGKRVTFANLLANIRNNIKVGGRNLLKGTKDFIGFVYAGVGGTITNSDELGMKVFKSNGPWSKIYRETTIYAGETYVFSVYVKPGNTKCTLFWDNNGDGTHSITTAAATELRRDAIEADGDWRRASMVIKCTKTGTAHFRIESEQPYSCAGYKLERGNIATDWTPAPEDLTSGGG